jgi:hypothetical protein
MAMIKFYDMKARKSVLVPESETEKLTKKGKNRTVKMLRAKGKAGNWMYRITK